MKTKATPKEESSLERGDFVKFRFPFPLKGGTVIGEIISLRRKVQALVKLISVGPREEGDIDWRREKAGSVIYIPISILQKLSSKELAELSLRKL